MPIQLFGLVGVSDVGEVNLRLVELSFVFRRPAESDCGGNARREISRIRGSGEAKASRENFPAFHTSFCGTLWPSSGEAFIAACGIDKKANSSTRIRFLTGCLLEWRFATTGCIDGCAHRRFHHK